MGNPLQRDTMDGPMMTEALPFGPGSIIAGKYIVERELAAGGSGVVVLATHLELGQRVAIKYLRLGHREHPMVIERFKREARLAASIRSEHVVRIYDVGALEDGIPYMVMEYLQGEDLASVLSKEGPLAIDRAVRYTLQACEALAEAHALGIIHRDLKPANLFLATRAHGPPIVKIVDFGISKVSGISRFRASATHVTGRQETFGTPHYMSPEQLVSSANVDARSDIWAIGVVLYALLTNRLPFEGDDLRKLIASVLSSAPTPVRDRRADVPPELERIVHACLAYDPRERPDDTADVVERLEWFLHADSAAQLRSTETSIEVSGIHDLGWVSWEPPAPRWRVSRWLVAVATASVVFGAALAVILWRPNASPSPRVRRQAEVIAASAPLFELVEPMIELDAGDAVAAAVTAPKPKLAPPVARPIETNDFGDRR